MWVSQESGFIKSGCVYSTGLQDCQKDLPFNTMTDGVSDIVVVFLGDFRARIWCDIPTGIQNLSSDDFPKPLCFEAEHGGPVDNYGQQGTGIHRCLMTFIDFLFIFKFPFFFFA